MTRAIPSGFYPDKILICQQRQIGDVLLMTPSLRLLSEKYPQAQLHVLTEKKCMSVLENNPLITKVWAIDKSAGTLATLQFYKELAKEKFDLTIDFQQLARLRLATLFCWADYRLSYPPKWYNALFYNVHSPQREGYAAKAKSGVLAPLGVYWNGEPPEIHLTDAERTWAREYLDSCGISKETPFFTIDPTHRRVTRKWPPEHYAGLIKLLLAHSPDLKLFMLYGPGELDDVRHIKELAGNPDRCIVSDYMTSLREMCAVIERADGHIGNCSSPRHFAVAVGTPTLTVLGSTKPGAWTYPSDEHRAFRNYEEVDCLGCNSSTCKNGTLQCLWKITPQIIFNQACELFPALNTD